MVNNYVTFDDVLKNPCKKVSVEEGKKIAVELINKLVKDKNAIGLAANQVGIDASVAVVNVIEPIIIINPKIIKMWDEISYVEGCLSFPGNPKSTKRYKYVQYTDSLIQESRGEDASVVYGPTSSETETQKKTTYERQLLESVCVQHEIDHLYGIRILDREQQLQPVISERKIGRNEKVTIKKENETQVIKYKKAKPFLDDGWVIQ